LHGEKTLSSPEGLLPRSITRQSCQELRRTGGERTPRRSWQELRKNNKSRKVDYYLAPSLANRRYITFEAQGDVLLTREG
jgi:hypothetical protein